ncbi:cell wall protein DAN4-like [Vanessa atalanta]|uniref:cell wall protein DAN4-like n=1 Tax=Vanessa atalanta TaxID=42275 RepID=UPI001FCDEDFC|nr:cell wall protein DAN4-like [Vanessa atalanta]
MIFYDIESQNHFGTVHETETTESPHIEKLLNDENKRLCLVARSMWDLRRYDDLQMDAPHENSTFYIVPTSQVSCMSSLVFPITGGGTLDVKLYMKPAAESDQITILAFQHEPKGVVGSLILSAMDPNFTKGWQHLKITLIGTGVYNGFVTLMGIASESSVILIDSVRFIAPSYSEEFCQIYKQDEEDDTNETTIPTIVPETSSTTIPETPSTIFPETTTTIVAETPSTIVPETPTTIIPETTTTIVAETPSTIVPETPTTIFPETTTTIVTETPSTIVPETPSTFVPETPSTIVPEKSSTVVPETTSYIVPETTSTIVLETTSTIVPETTSTIVPETPSTTMPETP